MMAAATVLHFFLLWWAVPLVCSLLSQGKGADRENGEVQGPAEETAA